MKDELKHIVAKLVHAKRLENIHFLLTGLSGALFVAVLSILIASFIEMISNGDSIFRTFLLSLIIFATLVALTIYLKPFLLRNFSKKHEQDLNSIAKRVGFSYLDVKDELSNTVQLMTSYDFQTSSGELTEYAFSRVYSKVKDNDFTVIINKRKTKKSLLLMFSIIVLTSILFFIFSGSLYSGFTRILNFDKEYIPPAPFILEISPKYKSLTRGDKVQITINAKGKIPENAELHIREFQQKNFEVLNLKPDSSGRFIYIISSVRNSLEFFARVPWLNTEVKTELCTLNVTSQPLIKSLTGRITYPSYTNLSQKVFDEQSADITAIRGSRVSFSIMSNKELKSATLVINAKETADSSKSTDTIRIPMNVSGLMGTIDYSIYKSANYYFEIIDNENQINREPVVYSMIVLNDEFPNISLIEPQSDVIIDENALLPVKVSISDDYGFSDLKLYYKLIQSRYTEPDRNYSSVNIPLLSGEHSLIIPYLWDMNKMNISPEDKYEFYLETTDNDVVAGPKSARTNTLTVRLPSLDEVLKSTDEMQKLIEQQSDKILKDAEELKKETEQLNRELMQKPKGSQMDWKEKKKAEEILNKQNSIQQKMKELEQNIQKMTENLEQNNAISPETMEKYMELQKLLKEVDSPELRKLQQQMEKAMQNMSKDQLEQAMKNTKFDEELFKKSIERTMKILKRLQAEQKTDAVQKRAEELEKKQDELNKQTENSNLNNKESRDKLAKEQENLRKDLQQLEKEAGELEKLMKEISEDIPLQDMDKAMDELNSDETSSEMQEAQKNLNQGEQAKASQSQKKAKSNLSKFSESMKAMKQKMQNNVTKEAIRKMQKAMSDLLELSKKQESLKRQTSEIDFRSNHIPAMTDEQMQIQQSLKYVASSMIELSEKSFAFTPQMGQQIGDAMQQMQNSMQQLNNRNLSASSMAQTEAMSSMNKTAAQMQSMLNSMQNKDGQCNNPGGQGAGQGQGMSFSQRMQQIAQQQQGINSGMQQMMGKPNSSGQLSPQQQAELGRIAKEQGQARKALEELAKEQKQMGGERKALGDLDRIAKEMNEVISDMQSGNITPETLRRQERILSRLLDANLSMNERDFEKERESKSAEQIYGNSPDKLKIDKLNRKQSIDEMLRSLQLDYTKDYELLIKKYFESLNNRSIGK